MSSGRKSMGPILCEASPQNNPEVHDFLICPFAGAAFDRAANNLRDSRAIAAVL
jgi:hypothetical protein